MDGITRRGLLDYCSLYCIRPSATLRSFYFMYGGRKYRVSDHEAVPEDFDGEMMSIYSPDPPNDLVWIHQAVISGEYVSNVA